MPRRLLITGASGFLGHHVAAAFVERGAAVRGLVRRTEAPVASGVERVLARGLDDASALARGLDGTDCVVHLAAQVHRESAGAETNRAVNVDGTAALLAAAERAGVGTFVFASSVKAVGEASETRWTEATAARPADPYGATKLEAERLVRGAAERGIHAPVLRLPLVYGPGMKANALRLFDLVASGVPLPLAGVRNRRSLLFTGNLVAAVLAAVASPQGSDIFFVSDNEDLSTPELVRGIARALGRPARLLPVPTALLRLAGRVGDTLGDGFPLNTAAVERLAGSLAVDPGKLMRATGYRPPFTVAEGLHLTAAWYRARRAGAR